MHIHSLIVSSIGHGDGAKSLLDCVIDVVGRCRFLCRCEQLQKRLCAPVNGINSFIAFLFSALKADAILTTIGEFNKK